MPQRGYSSIETCKKRNSRNAPEGLPFRVPKKSETNLLATRLKKLPLLNITSNKGKFDLRYYKLLF